LCDPFATGAPHGIADPAGLPDLDGPRTDAGSGRRPGTEGRTPESAGSVSSAASAAVPAAAGATATWSRQSPPGLVEILPAARPLPACLPARPAGYAPRSRPANPTPPNP